MWFCMKHDNFMFHNDFNGLWVTAVTILLQVWLWWLCQERNRHHGHIFWLLMVLPPLFRPTKSWCHIWQGEGSWGHACGFVHWRQRTWYNQPLSAPLYSLPIICLSLCGCSSLAAIMHLYYARFINHFLHNCGLVPKLEPFVNLLTQGMVMGKSFKVRKTGKYLRPDEVDFSRE